VEYIIFFFFCSVYDCYNFISLEFDILEGNYYFYMIDDRIIRDYDILSECFDDSNVMSMTINYKLHKENLSKFTHYQRIVIFL